MACEFADNAFCASLDEEVRQAFCEKCHVRHYEKGKVIADDYFNKGLAVLLSGMGVAGAYDESDGRFVCNGLVSRGCVIGLDEARAQRGLEDAPDRSLMLVTDCDVALFDSAALSAVLKAHPEAELVILRAVLSACSFEKNRFVQAVASKDSYTAVRYVVEFCRNHGVEVPTHEMIALVCNRARSTVTGAMHEIAMREPELFQPRDDLDALV